MEISGAAGNFPTRKTPGHCTGMCRACPQGCPSPGRLGRPWHPRGHLGQGPHAPHFTQGRRSNSHLEFPSSLRTWEEGGQPKALSNGSPAPSLPGLWSAGHMVFTASHVRLSLWFRPGRIPDRLCPALTDSFLSTGQLVLFPVFQMGR